MFSFSEEEFLKEAAKQEAQGNSFMAGLLRVEAANCKVQEERLLEKEKRLLDDKSFHQKSNTPKMPRYCMDCGKELLHEKKYSLDPETGYWPSEARHCPECYKIYSNLKTKAR